MGTAVYQSLLPPTSRQLIIDARPRGARSARWFRILQNELPRWRAFHPRSQPLTPINLSAFSRLLSSSPTDESRCSLARRRMSSVFYFSAVGVSSFGFRYSNLSPLRFSCQDR